MTAREFIVIAMTVLALALLAVASFLAYSQPAIDTANLFGLISPLLAAVVVPLAAIGLHIARSLGSIRLLGLGALVAALYFTVPLYVGLRQQSASDLQLSLAATFISWLAAAAGLAGAFAASIVIFIYNQIAAQRDAQHRRHLIHAIERETAARLSAITPAAVELGPRAFEALTEDWGSDADRVVVDRNSGRFIGLASERWPVASSFPTLELEIVHTGSDDHVQVR